MTNVFIDTQVFVQKNFNFNGVIFKKLVNASLDGLITIYITDVVKNEIESQIAEQVYEKVKNAHNKFSVDSKILRNLDYYQNIFSIPEGLDHIYHELIGQFNLFLKNASVEIISVNDVSPSLIFEKYFKSMPPFSMKKKDEFPDAFSMEALEKWAKQQNGELSIVSGDVDLKQFCDESQYLIYEPSLESFFNCLMKNKTYIYRYLTSVYDDNYSLISETVQNYFEEHWFILDEDGEVDKMSVDLIELDDEPYILEIKENDDSEMVKNRKGHATWVFNAKIFFKAVITYIDYSNSFYDKEEHRYLFLNHVNTEIEDNIEIPVLMKIEFDYNNKEKLDIIVTTINEDEAIHVSVTSDYY